MGGREQTRAAAAAAGDQRGRRRRGGGGGGGGGALCRGGGRERVDGPGLKVEGREPYEGVDAGRGVRQGFQLGDVEVVEGLLQQRVQ